MSLITEQGTHHDLDHHAAVRTCEPGAAERVHELRNHRGNEEHRHAHGPKIREHTRGREEDHAICVYKGVSNGFRERRGRAG